MIVNDGVDDNVHSVVDVILPMLYSRLGGPGRAEGLLARPPPRPAVARGDYCIIIYYVRP